MSNINSNRLNILTEAEKKALYCPPSFNDEQQKHYFNLIDEEKSIIKKLDVPSNIYFILLNGYFKAKHQLFDIDVTKAKADINYIINLLSLNTKLHINFKLPSIRTQTRLKTKVLRLHNFKTVSPKERNDISTQALYLVQQHNKPKIIFYELIKYIERKKYILPAYSIMQDIVGQAISIEMSRLMKLISRFLSKKNTSSLDELLSTEESLYGITELKQDMKNFNSTQIRQEIAKRDKYYELYKFSKSLLPKEQSYLYLICYIYHRTQKINDNLIQCFIYQVSKYFDDAVAYGKKEFLMFKERVEFERDKLGLILSYFLEKSLQKYRFSTVVRKAYKLMPKDTISKVSALFLNEERKEIAYRWDYFIIKKHAISLNIKPLFMALDFECNEANNSIMTSVNVLRKFYRQKQPLSKLNTEQFPDDLIPKNIQVHLKEGVGINPHKYIFMIYYRLMRYINNNKSFFNDSLSFKSFEEDIKIVENWADEKKSILKRLSLPKLETPLKTRLNVLEDELEAAYEKVNKRIINGENENVNLKDDDGSWTLRYPKSPDDVYNHKFYNELSQLSINDVFDFVESKCNFVKLFDHKLQRYSKKKDHYPLTKACIIANATRQGIYNMARSSNLSHEQLRQTEQDRLRIETLKAACDKVSQSIEKLELFHRRNIYSNGYYGSIDGSKHITKRNTLKSRYSKKYFGLEKGIVSLNMVVND